MKQFIYRLSFFFLPLLLVFGAAEYILRHMDSSYAIKKEQIQAKNNQIQILIMGNSHASDGINPASFQQPAFNLAYGSQTILYDKALLAKYTDQLPQLKYVLISMDYPVLYWGFVKERDFFYYHYYDINLENNSFWKENLSYFFYVYTPKPAIELLLHQPKVQLENGWASFDGTKADEFTDAVGQQRVDGFDLTIKNSKASGEHVHIRAEIDTMIQSLLQKKITPILITSPCSYYFTSKLNPAILAENQAYIAALQKKYNLVYFNSLTDPRFKAEHFYNTDHLNKKGAAIYSALLDSVIQAHPNQLK